MPEKISLFRGTGENLSSSIVSIFLVPDTDKRYIITTENAVDPHGLTVLHVSEIVDDALVKVSNDEEWTTIKTIMRAIISNNVGSFQYLPVMERAKAEGQYSRDISVSSSASKQMIDNYIAADKVEVVKDEVAKVEEEQNENVQGNSIFPSNSVKPTEENEVAPGIADVATSPKPIDPVAMVMQMGNAPVSGAAQTAAPVQAPIVEQQVAQEQPVLAAPVEQPIMAAPVEQPTMAVQNPVQQVQMMSNTQQIPIIQNNMSNTQQIPVVQNNGMYQQDVQMAAPMYVDQGVASQMSSFGVTSGYSTIPPMENMYNQMYRNDPMLEQVVLQAQEMMNETIRSIVYMIYDRTKQVPQMSQIQQMYQPMMNSTLYGGQMAAQMMQPYGQMVQPMVIQVPNDIQ